MSQQHEYRCPNCGTEWAAETDRRDDAIDVACPVCHFHLSQPLPAVEGSAGSVDDLQARLVALVTEARSGGVQPQEIVGILRNELAFEAELLAPGRRMLVQIIDLGQFEPGLRPQHAMPEPEMAHSRALGQ